MAQYTFVDTVENTSSVSLPAEALSLNGEYIEELIPGYRTLRVSGRELLNRELTTLEVGTRDGSYLKSTRFPARTITVEYQLISATDEAFRTAYNQLNSILNVTDAECIFSDEPDKYFIGTPNNPGDVPGGRNSIISSFEILCLDPFKYAVEEHEVLPAEGVDDDNTFVIDYQGTVRSYPVLEADFYQSDVVDDNNGRCGYVAFVNDREKVLQFGNLDEGNPSSERYVEVVIGSKTTWMTSEQLVNKTFKSDSTDWAKNEGITNMSTGYTITGSVKIDKLEDSSKNEKTIMPMSYGSGTGWHGPSILKAIPADSKGRQEATDWTAQFHYRFALGLGEETRRSKGALQCFLWNSSSQKIIAGLTIYKGSYGLVGAVRYYVNSRFKKEGEMYLGKTNLWSGWEYQEGKKKPGPGIITITKKGDTVTFAISKRDASNNYVTVKNTFKDPAIKSVIVDRYQFNMYAYKDFAPVRSLGIYWAKFTSNSVLNTKTEYTTEELPVAVNIDYEFGTNDVLMANVGAASVYVNDTEKPSIGALGNEWEEFYLLPGINQIHCAYSDFVDDEYKPSFKLRYREVYL